MTRTALVSKLVWCIVILACVNLAGSLLHWYETLWWFDMPMHFLGGVCVLYISAIVGQYFWREGSSVQKHIWAYVISGLVLGLLWECLEYVLYRYSGGSPSIPLDIISDLFFDSAGIAVAAISTLSIIENN